MIGFKIIFLSAILLLPSLDAKQIKCEQILCNECQYSFDMTYPEFAISYLSGAVPSPEDGTCLKGVKWIIPGANYGFSRNACCCHSAYSAESVCSATNNVQCPLAPLIAPSERFIDYYQAAPARIPNSPANGCCPRADTFKWILPSFATGASQDMCICVIRNQFASL